MRRWVANQGRISVEEREGIYIKRWGVKSRNNLVTLWCTDSKT